MWCRWNRLVVLVVLGAALAAAPREGEARRKGKQAREKKVPVAAPAAVQPAPAVPGVQPSGLPVLAAFAAPDPVVVAEISALVDALDVEGTRAEARRQLIAMGPAASPVLAGFFADPRFTVRWEMVNIQGDVRDARLVPHLVDRALRDEDAHVRWRSLWAINEHRDRTEAVRLARAAMASADDSVSWNAAVGLSMMGSTDCLPLIHAGLQRADSWQRWEAINALGRVHDDTSVATILAALPALVDRDRNEAALALGMIGGDAALDALIGLLRDPEPSVRWRAAMGLGQARDVRGIAPLEALLVTETDPLVTEHARRALDGLRAAVPSPRP